MKLGNGKLRENKKNPQNVKITLLFTDISKSCPSHEVLRRKYDYECYSRKKESCYRTT